MITEVIMPALGETLDEATIVAWHKKEGEWVEKGKPLLEVLTDKAEIEVEAMASGYLRAILRGEGEAVPITQVIAYLADSMEEPLPAPGGVAPERAAPPPRAEAPAEVPSPPEKQKRLKVSPRARRLAEEEGVDISLVTPTGPGGRIVEADVKRYLAQRAEEVTPPPTPAVVEAPVERVVPLAGVRKVIAERMAHSHRTAARVTLTTEADATELVALRARLKDKMSDLKITYTDLLVQIVAAVLKRHPMLNAALVDEEIHLHEAVHMGIAVDTERGLIVPVLRDADTKGLAAIAQESKDLAERAHQNRLQPDEMRGGTFTLTNLGTYGIDAFTPLINPPETAVLGVGRIVAKPVVYKGEVVVRQMVALSLSFDHRVVDGGPAARFLQEVKGLVEEPALLLLAPFWALNHTESGAGTPYASS
jgi:pyruvate dehydrogenase E2 component (dihydrolipoamide acetyltransferase)